jgi:hypothetical protein
MGFQDILIRGRESLVNLLLGGDTSTVLNPELPETQMFSNGTELVAEVKKAINAFKANAMDADGHQVDYSLLSESDSYQAYCSCVFQLHYLDLNTLKSSPERLAFWINLYNTLTVDAVIQFGVEKSVTEGRLGILSFFEKAAYQIGDQRFSLTDIEHGILRANRGFPYFIGPHFSSNDPRRDWALPSLDPRIHFALNCAGQSCPPIGVYSPDQIDVQLDLASRNFVDANISVDPRLGVLSLSSIFRWYQGDFGGRTGIIDFLMKYLPDDDRKEWLLGSRDAVKLRFQHYNWDLNSVRLPSTQIL